MLELRPICEHCAKALPPDSGEAMICSFECTFCLDCVESVLGNVCPNCGGGFAPRPIRPRDYVAKYPPVAKPKHRPVDVDSHRRFAEKIGSIPPDKR